MFLASYFQIFFVALLLFVQLSLSQHVLENVDCDYYVRIDGGSSSGCDSYEEACNTIERAQSKASSSKTICVYPGTYYISDTISDKNAYIYGVEGPEKTIIDGSSNKRCLYLNDRDNFQIEGFTFRNCKADNGGAFKFYCSSAITYYQLIKNCIFENNYADNGGAFHNTMCCPTLQDVIMRNNTASDDGGAFYCYMNVGWTHPTLTFTNVMIVDNGGGGQKNIFDRDPDTAGADYSCKVNGDELQDCNECYNGGNCKQDGECYCLEGSSLPSPDCEFCLPGTYSDTINADSCTDCGTGAYNPNSGSTTSEDCLQCPEGTFNNLTHSASVDDCLACPTGTYNVSPRQSICTHCGTGTYNPNEGSTTSGDCLQCPEGTFNNLTDSGSADDCLKCPVGTYNPDKGQSVCLKCPVGTYNPNEGKIVCLKCPVGTYNPDEGQTVCVNCTAGTYNTNEESTKPDACEKCAKGTYNPAEGQSVCLNCTIGTYNPYQGATSEGYCEDCPEGRYANQEGSGFCQECPRGTYNEETKATVCAECVIGTYNAKKGSKEISNCLSCPQGTYGDQLGMSTCKNCSMGSYNTETRQTECSPCEIGSFTDQEGEATCQKCGIGTYANQTGSSACMLCEKGTYSDREGQQNCQSCALGTYNPNLGSTGIDDCLKCEVGTYSGIERAHNCELCAYGQYNSLEGSSQCSLCKPGTYSDTLGATVCQFCGIGEHQDTYGSAECNKCPFDTYQDEVGTAECKYCPNYSATLCTYNKEITDCYCMVGYYGEPGEHCTKCPTGGECSTFNQRVPVSLPGYWNSEENPINILLCPVYESCPGGETGKCNGTLGYTGTQCTECLSGFYKYSGKCVTCPSNNWIRLFFASVLFAFCTTLLLFIARKGKNYFGSLSIIISFFQVIAILPNMMLNWPNKLLTFFKSLSLFNFNIELLALECSINLTYPVKWFAIMLMPFLTILLLIVIYMLLHLHSKAISKIGLPIVNTFPRLCARPSSTETIKFLKPLSFVRFQIMKFFTHSYSKESLVGFKNSCINTFVASLFIMYLILAFKIFDFFDCTKISDDLWVLDSDGSYNCLDDWWYGMLPYVIVFGLLYIPGIPLFISWMLWYHSKNVDERVFEQRIGLLCNRYRKEWFFWELVVMVRKILIVLFGLYLTKYPRTQIIICNVIFLLSIIFQAECNPYNTAPRNALEFILLCVTQFVLLSGMVFVSEDFSANGQTGTEDFLANIVITMIAIAVLILAIVSGYEFRDRIRYKNKRSKLRRLNKFREKKEILQFEPIIKFLKKKPKFLTMIMFLASIKNSKLKPANKFFWLMKCYFEELPQIKRKWQTKNQKSLSHFQKTWRKTIIILFVKWYHNKASLIWKIRIQKMLEKFLDHLITVPNKQKKYTNYKKSARIKRKFKTLHKQEKEKQENEKSENKKSENEKSEKEKSENEKPSND
ncbi:hypothetical protein M0813_21981 [Anaeramoeba flamelloides]|uniref:Tyrosine-protein kinase ephrin type A/B receptor-like domain-containing protein n=1 Tax=Anaeramoeba flamelloides TaxID=1746091 RepID=A0ABQ8YG21_9EUKA|nr:hypothetical protein M0813_21981 [Anaeramoeba flamelloides]